MTTTRAFTIVTSIVLARLLLPQDFGIANVGTLILSVVLPITDIGIAQALVRTPADEVAKKSRTAFWLVIALGLILYTVVWLSSDLLARFFNEDRIGLVLRVLGLTVVVHSISRIPSALLERNLRYGPKATPEILGSITYGVCAIALALAGFGFWSIIYATFLRYLIVGVGVIIAAHWWPGLIFDTRVARELIAYAHVLMASSLLRLVYTNVDNAVVGRVSGMGGLGFYAVAYNLGNLSAVQVAGPLGSVLFSAYSRMLPDLTRVRRANLLTLRYLSLLISPVTTVGMAAAPYLVPVVLGPRWTPMVMALQILLVYGYVRTLAPVHWMLMLAGGLERLNLRINLMSLLLAVAIALPVALVGGYAGVALEFTALEVARLAWIARTVEIHFGLGLAAQLRATGPGMLGGLLAGMTMLGLSVVLPPRDPGELAAELLTAGTLYLGFLATQGEFSRANLLRARELLTSARQ